MVIREEQIAKEIKDEFCKRVIPSDLMRYLTCLTTQDIEKVQAEEKCNGSTQAADCLLQRLVRRSDWLHQLKQALLNPDVGLVDFGQRIEQRCQQLTVVVAAPSDCTDGHNCEKETPRIAYQPVCFPVTPVKNDDKISVLDEEKTESAAEIEKRVKLTIIDLALRDITSVRDIPQALALAEAFCVKIDSIVHRCIAITFRMNSIEQLEGFWQLYRTGGLADVLSRDILTTQRRHQLKDEARKQGVELTDSDLYLQVTITESDYKFVKDTLTFQNVPLLPRSSVESVLLHGNPTESQYDKNKSLVMFRQAIPSKLQRSFDDPYVQDSIPEYFTHLTKLGAVESVRYFYRMLIDKLKAEFRDKPDQGNIYHIAYFLSDCPQAECEFKDTGNTVELFSGEDRLSIISEVWAACSKFLEINFNKVKFVSNLVLTFFALYYATEIDTDGVSKLLKLELFPLIAGALLPSIERPFDVPHNILAEYLYYKLLYLDSIGDELLNFLTLELDLNRESMAFLKSARQDGCEIKLHMDIPSNAKLSNGSEETPRQRMASNDSGVISSTLRILNICIKPGYEENEDTLPCPVFSTDTNELHLPDSPKDLISLVICIAKAVNLLGSGEVKVKVRSDQTTTNTDHVSRLFSAIIHHSLYPSAVNTNDDNQVLDNDNEEKSGIELSKRTDVTKTMDKSYRTESIGVLRLNLAAFNMKDADISKLETAFQNGLQVTELNLTNAGVNYIDLVKLCNAAFTANITELVVSDNRLFDSTAERDKSLGLQTLVSLELLEMSNCELGDKGIEVIQDDLIGLKKLRSVDFSKNGFSEEGIRIFCNSLRNSTSIRALRVHENNFGPKGALILSIFVDRLEFLEIINVCRCGLENSGIVPLGKALKTKKIKKMNFRENNVTKEGSKEFLHSIKDFKFLNHFEFGNNEIRASQRLPLQSCSNVQTKISDLLSDMLLSCGGSLEYLGLWRCGVGNTTVLDDTKVFSKMHELTEIILQANELGDKHATTLGDCLPTMKNLQTLMLRSNRIGPIGARKLTIGIGECPSLQTITLDRNQISDFGVLKELVETVGRKLTHLIELDVSYNVETVFAREDGKFEQLLTAARNCFIDERKEKTEDGRTTISNQTRSRTIII